MFSTLTESVTHTVTVWFGGSVSCSCAEGPVRETHQYGLSGCWRPLELEEQQKRTSPLTDSPLALVFALFSMTEYRTSMTMTMSLSISNNISISTEFYTVLCTECPDTEIPQ